MDLQPPSVTSSAISGKLGRVRVAIELRDHLRRKDRAWTLRLSVREGSIPIDCRLKGSRTAGLEGSRELVASPSMGDCPIAETWETGVF